MFISCFVKISGEFFNIRYLVMFGEYLFRSLLTLTIRLFLLSLLTCKMLSIVDTSFWQSKDLCFSKVQFINFFSFMDCAFSVKPNIMQISC